MKSVTTTILSTPGACVAPSVDLWVYPYCQLLLRVQFRQKGGETEDLVLTRRVQLPDEELKKRKQRECRLMKAGDNRHALQKGAATLLAYLSFLLHHRHVTCLPGRGLS